jgi:hypothetical protein
LYGIAITGVAAIGGSIIGSILTQRHNIKIAEKKWKKEGEGKKKGEDDRKKIFVKG